MNSQDVKTVTLVINSDQAKKKLEEINLKLEAARRKRQEAFDNGDAKGLQAYTREVKNLESQAARLQARAQTVAKTLTSLDKATPNELRKTIKEINKELNSGSVERGSEEWKALTSAIAQAKSELAKIREEQTAAARLGDSASAFGQRWVGLSTVVTQARDTISSAISVMKDYVSDYADMQEHMANVTKYTGLAADQVDELNESFQKMETRTPREKLNDLAADAGRLGIQTKEGVQEFVEAADIINTALGEDLGEDAVKNIGKLAQMFGESDRLGLRGAMLATGSVINELAQSSSAAEGVHHGVCQPPRGCWQPSRAEPGTDYGIRICARSKCGQRREGRHCSTERIHRAIQKSRKDGASGWSRGAEIHRVTQHRRQCSTHRFT